MAFDPDAFLREVESKKKKIAFKDSSVADEFEGVDPQIQSDLSASPFPITVTSGRRSPETNATVGGVPNSAHVHGRGTDLRLDENTPHVRSYLEGLGYKVIPESDHLHTELPENKKTIAKAPFDPDAFMAQAGIGVDPIGSNQESSILDPLSTFFRKGTQSATAGLSEPIASGISSMIDRDLQKGGYTPERSITDSYKYFKDKQAQSLAEQEAQNPNAALAGEIAGFVSPLGVFSEAYKGANLLTKGVGRGLEAAAPILAKTPKLLKGIGQAALRGGLTNTAYQGIRGEVDPESNQDLGDAFLLGSAGDVVGSGLAKVISKGIGALARKTNDVAARQMNSIIGTPLKDLKRGKNLGKELIERNIFGSENKLQKVAEKGLSKYEGRLDEALKSVKKNVDIDKVIKELDDLKVHYVNTPGSANEVRAIDDLITEIRTSPRFRDVTPSEANKIKRSLYKKVNTGYDRDVVSLKKELDKATARGYKKSIEDVAPEVKDINKELSVYGRLQDSIEGVLAKKEKTPPKALSLRDLPALATGGFFGGAPGAAVAYGIDRAITGTMGKTASALGLSKASKLLNRVAGNSPKSIGKSSSPKLLQLIPPAANNVVQPRFQSSRVADWPLPESPETIALQIDSLMKGNSQALLVTPGAQKPSTPKGMKTLETEVGTWVFDPSKISPSTIEKKVKDGTHGELLGHVEPKSAKTTKTVVAIKDGKEAKTSLVSDRNIRKQYKSIRKQFPDAEIEISDLGLSSKILEERLKNLMKNKRSNS